MIDKWIMPTLGARGVRLPMNMAGRVATKPYTMAEVRRMLALVNGADGIMLRVLL